MNLSYLRVRRPLKDALEQFHAWIGVPEVEPAREVPERESIDLALEGEDWKGLAVFIFPWGAWTVFQELSGGLGGRGAAELLLRLADGGDLVYAGWRPRGRLRRTGVHHRRRAGAPFRAGRR